MNQLHLVGKCGGVMVAVVERLHLEMFFINENIS